MAWGIYSLRGKGVADATLATAGNFLRAGVLSVGLSSRPFPGFAWMAPDSFMRCSRAPWASGLGYVLWYIALGGLKATVAATVQLSVPVLAAMGGVIFLNEAMTLRMAIAQR
ncbi:MAG: EamA family transporter [Nitrospiria bacterium]